MMWGSGAPLRQFIYSRDLAKLFMWTLRDYKEIDPIILSGPSPLSPLLAPRPESSLTSHLAVGEDEEISIKQVGDTIVKLIGFEGDYSVRPCARPWIDASRLIPLASSSTRPSRTASSASPPRTTSSRSS